MGQHKGSRPSRPRKYFAKLRKEPKEISAADAKKSGEKDFLRVSIGLGALLMVALLALGPVLVPALAGRTGDWFSYWTGWLPGVCSVAVSFSSILITVHIANEQAKQNERLNEMQTHLTLAANLPSLHVSAVEFYSRDVCLKQTSGTDKLEMEPMLYRFNIFFPTETFPANYGVVLEEVFWDFPKLSHKETSEKNKSTHGTLEPGDFSMRISRGDRQAKLQLDFQRQEMGKYLYFDSFYRYPELRGFGENSVKLTLRLRMDNLLLKAVMAGAGLEVKPNREAYADRMDLNLLLFCKREYTAGDPPHSPVIVVEDHSISAPREEA